MELVEADQNFDALLPHLQGRLGPLVGPMERQRLADLAKHLPPLYNAGLEVRLGVESQVDFVCTAFHWRGHAPSAPAWAIFDAWNPTHLGPGWQGLPPILHPSLARECGIQQAFLEIDMPQGWDATGLPGFFLCLKPARLHMIERLTALRTGSPLRPDDRDLIRRVAGLPREDWVMLGWFASRQESGLRVSMPPGDPGPALRASGWSGRVNGITRIHDELVRLGMRVVPYVDVGGGLRESFGLEIFDAARAGFRTTFPALARWLLGERLADAGRLITVEKWPGAQMARSHAQGRTYALVARSISHFKISWNVSGAAQAKAYLTFRSFSSKDCPPHQAR